MPAPWPECGRIRSQAKAAAKAAKASAATWAARPAGVAGRGTGPGAADLRVGVWVASSPSERLARLEPASFGAGSRFRRDFGRKWAVCAPKSIFAPKEGAKTTVRAAPGAHRDSNGAIAGRWPVKPAPVTADG